MASVFISYNRQSETVAATLAGDIEALGHTVWFDHELSGGQSWWDQILATIRRCDVFVFVLDPAALESTACKLEYGYAADLGKPILPVLVSEGVSTNLLPRALSLIQFVDYRKADRQSALRLGRAFTALPPARPLPDPLPPPPDAPLSYLGGLSQQVEKTSPLSYQEQSALVMDLRRSLRDPGTAGDARTLLGKLRNRHDVFARIAEEIDELLGSARTTSPTPHIDHKLPRRNEARDAVEPPPEPSFTVPETPPIRPPRNWRAYAAGAGAAIFLAWAWWRFDHSPEPPPPPPPPRVSDKSEPPPPAPPVQDKSAAADAARAEAEAKAAAAKKAEQDKARAAAEKTKADETAAGPLKPFRDCPECPDMVVIPAGSVTMGSPGKEPGRDANEGPQHRVSIARAFSAGRFHVTRAQFVAFVRETSHDAGDSCYAWTGQKFEDQAGKNWRDPGFAQTDDHPVVCVNWNDARAYVAWLARKTGKGYRLLTEAEWEYAARADTGGRRYWGENDADTCRYANVADASAKARYKFTYVFACDDKHAETAPVGRFRPNDFGLYDMIGNARQWTEDCWNANYNGAPADGSAWTAGECGRHVVRGSSWYTLPHVTRAASRLGSTSAARYSFLGFRVARTN